jgi:hypothetical protein
MIFLATRPANQQAIISLLCLLHPFHDSRNGIGGSVPSTARSCPSCLFSMSIATEGPARSCPAGRVSPRLLYVPGKEEVSRSSTIVSPFSPAHHLAQPSTIQTNSPCLYQDCGKVVASKFFPTKVESGKTLPLCERDYFRRLNLVCENCGEALRGAYISALDKKYHVEHFTCSMCEIVFGPEDSYYEHGGKVYCHYHYSVNYAVKCSGCKVAILKQFVEINRNSVDEFWHPECYMIHKVNYLNSIYLKNSSCSAEMLIFDFYEPVK